jgi:hypothetical protein
MQIYIYLVLLYSITYSFLVSCILLYCHFTVILYHLIDMPEGSLVLCDVVVTRHTSNPIIGREGKHIIFGCM